MKYIILVLIVVIVLLLLAVVLLCRENAKLGKKIDKQTRELVSIGTTETDGSPHFG